MSESPLMPPDEQSTRSMSRAFSSCASATVSSSPHSPPFPSTAETRKNSGLSCGHAARTVSATSSAKRMRFSRDPPYSSVRWLDTGERNWWIR